jgi:membrane fusion protein (multidrug efflux system)
MSRTQVMILCALGVALAAGGCAEPEPVAAAPVAQQSAPGPAEAPALHEVQAGSVRRTLRVESHIATEPEVTLVAHSTGQLLRVLVKRGESVARDQPLAEFDSHEEKLALSAAQAELVLAEFVEDSRRRLHEEKFLAKERWEEAKFALELARARLDLATHRVEQTTVRAPFDGVILDRMAQPGMYILEAHAVPLFRLSGEGPLEARVYLPEWSPAYLEDGSAVQVYSLLGDVPMTGTVQWLSPVVDAVAGTVEARVRLEADAPVRRGSSVRLEFELHSDPDMPSVPLASLVDPHARPGEMGAVMEVSPEGGFQRKEVLLGLLGDGRAEVRQGLAPGDHILASASRSPEE